jgi:hypothetical protein
MEKEVVWANSAVVTVVGAAFKTYSQQPNLLFHIPGAKHNAGAIYTDSIL